MGRVIDLAIRAGRVVVGADRTGPALIEIADGRISRIRRDGADPYPGVRIVTAANATVTAGFIDLHTHGADGAQAIDGLAASIDTMAAFYARHGVTGFLATIGGSNESIEAGIAAVRSYLLRPAPNGSACLGIHLEGPFINPGTPGAFRRESVVAPDANLLARYAGLAGGALRLITLAPELPGAGEVIKAAVDRGIRCSAGHSAATASQMVRAVDNGVHSATHVFNAMRPLHHREPGLLGVILTDERVVAELIADGLHVHPIAMRLLSMAKGPEGVALVTDSIGSAGLKDGRYAFEEQEVHVAGGSARLADGTLAGSTLSMDRAVLNFGAAAGISWERASVAATSVPADVLGLSGTKGRIAAGFDADLVAFDEAHQVIWTMVGGELVYSR